MTQNTRTAAARWCLAGAVFLLVQAFPGFVEGQNQILFRFDPLRDAEVHTLFQTVARVETEDGDVVETADLGSIRSIALELEEGGTVLHLAYDSVRGRVRSNWGAWREFNIPGADSVWVQVHIDDHMQVSATHAESLLPAVTGLLDIVTGVPDLTLPEQPVRIGGGWLVDSGLPERIAGAIPGEVGELPSMTFSTRVTLDSMVMRSRDTLGYLTVSGYIHPTTDADLQVLSEERLAISSEMAGQLVWSSGWGGFVSGAKRVTMQISMTQAAAAPAIEQQELELRMSVTTRFKVQP